HYHKTTSREIYNKHKQANIFDVLLWNDRKEITEFTNGNIVVDIDGNLYTPPISCGLLPGTFRKHLLNENLISERVIPLDKLSSCNAIWFINSVRKWVPVYIKKLQLHIRVFLLRLIRGNSLLKTITSYSQLIYQNPQRSNECLMP